jgi:hypothetical protein
MRPFQTPSVNGIAFPRRRFTGWAAFYFIVFPGVPILGLALILDVIFYLVFTRFLETCHGVFCPLI